SIFIATGIVSASILEALHVAIEQLTKANRQLLSADSDKDLLLREASHRFKNELSILGALLRLQQRSLSDGAASSALSSTADRVQVLARVHERLQRAEQGAVVDTRDFISALCDDLKAALVG